MLQFLCIVFGCDAIILTGRLCFFPLETNKADFIFPMSPEIVFTAELFCFSPKKTESEKVDERDDDVDDETSKSRSIEQQLSLVRSIIIFDTKTRFKSFDDDDGGTLRQSELVPFPGFRTA